MLGKKWKTLVMLGVMALSLWFGDTAYAATDLVAAKQNVDQAKVALDQAEEELAEAQKNYDEQKDLPTLREKGSMGFFEYYGYSSAMEVLQNKASWVTSTTNIGKEGDSTSLENLKGIIPFLYESNEVRMKEGKDPVSGKALGTLMVSPTLVAIEELQANWAAYNMDHAGNSVSNYNVGENLAWGFNSYSPFRGWVDEEKTIWLNALADSDMYPGLANCRTVYEVYSRYPYLYHEVGHYLNACDGQMGLLGFAMNQLNSGYGTTHGQALAYPNDYRDAMTVEEFERKVNDYCAYVDKVDSGNTNAYEALQNAIAKQQRCLDAYEKAQEALYALDYSLVYDLVYYADMNPDVVNALGTSKKELLKHFVDRGMMEGRRANAEFDVNYYRETNGDLQAAFGDDLLQYYAHYMLRGKEEGRKGVAPVEPALDYSAVFNAEDYKKYNPDVAAFFGDDLERLMNHFIYNGMAEGRQGSEEFNLQAYKDRYADLVAVFGDDNVSYYMHYINNGKAEGRNAKVESIQPGQPSVDYSAVYNVDDYKKYNPDVAATFGNDEAALLNHFVNNGMAEGRQGSDEFSLKAYMERYSDLVLVFGDDNVAYYMHYINNGRAEGRNGKAEPAHPQQTEYSVSDYEAVFNTQFYADHNSDVVAVYGSSEAALLRHFVENGMREGRQGSAEFILSVYKAKNSDLIKVYGDANEAYYMHYINYGMAEGRPAV